MAVFLVYLVQPVHDAFRHPHSTAYRIAVVTLVAAYSVSFLVIWPFVPRLAKWQKVAAVAWLTVFPIAVAALAGPGALVFMTYTIVIAVLTLPRNLAVGLGFGTAALLFLLTWTRDGVPDWSGALILAVTTIAMYGFAELSRTVNALRAAQSRVAELAVAEERNRVARDLHDVLGHSLTTITVKAGLARRLMERGDLARAMAESRDVEGLARQAVADVRTTVSGYRTVSLPAELVGAREALRAAGITADLPHAVDNVPPSLREIFGYVLREGVTNVIRHSGATRCEVRLGASWLEIRDNGRGTAGGRSDGAATGTAPAAPEATGVGPNGHWPAGHGLTGLAERLRAVGGELTAGPGPDGGFVLRASVPAAALAGAPATVGASA
jgi:two-component system sensor histidine kinase DesK